jgi:hypothetical protein
VSADSCPQGIDVSREKVAMNYLSRLGALQKALQERTDFVFAFDLPSKEPGAFLTLGKGWASGKSGALKNILSGFNLVDILKSPGKLLIPCPGCTPDQLVTQEGLVTSFESSGVGNQQVGPLSSCGGHGRFR